MLVPYLEIFLTMNLFFDAQSCKYRLRDEKLCKKTHNTSRPRENTYISTFQCKFLHAHAHTFNYNHVTDSYAGVKGVRRGQQRPDLG